MPGEQEGGPTPVFVDRTWLEMNNLENTPEQLGRLVELVKQLPEGQTVDDLDLVGMQAMQKAVLAGKAYIGDGVSFVSWGDPPATDEVLMLNRELICEDADHDGIVVEPYPPGVFFEPNVSTAGVEYGDGVVVRADAVLQASKVAEGLIIHRGAEVHFSSVESDVPQGTVVHFSRVGVDSSLGLNSTLTTAIVGNRTDLGDYAKLNGQKDVRLRAGLSPVIDPEKMIIVGDDCSFGQGLVLGAGVTIGSNVDAGDNFNVLESGVVEDGVVVGDDVTVGAGEVLRAA